MDSVTEAIKACNWGSSQYLIFSSNVFDPLIYYSHLTAFIVTLGFGVFVFVKNRKTLVTKILFSVIVFLCVWLIGDLIVWATEFNSLTMFFWSTINLVEPFVYATAFYFVYVFLRKKDLSFRALLFVFLPLLPVIILTPTNFALLGFDLSSCDRDAVEGPLVYYSYILELLYIVAILVLSFLHFRNSNDRSAKIQTIYITLGTVLFLLSFAFGNIIGSWFGKSTILGDYSWTIGQYGLFGVPIFIGFLSYMIVRFRMFNIGLIAVQALVFALLAVLASEYAFVTTTTNRILVSVTLLLTGITGIMLIRSVRKEIEQRERIEKLARELQKANDQQVVLIHFITHQIKGFVAKSRNIFSMALEGDFGPVSDSLKPMLVAGFESDTKGVATIQEILNAANIKSGKVAFKMAPFDLRELISDVVKDLRTIAENKGLIFSLDIGEQPLMVTGDRSQLVNAYKNIIDNSIKYTPTGTVHVGLSKDGALVKFKVEDTGVGITPEDMKNLFTEGGHGKESAKVNVDSTGFGLYIVKNIVDAHKGKVWAESEGTGKGSRFIIELPA